MHATSISLPPPAIARARLVVVGCAGGLLHRIIASVRSLQEFDYVSAGELAAEGEESLISRLRHWFWVRKGGRGFLLDGFPAHARQAVMFDHWLDVRDECITACLVQERPEAEAVEEAESMMLCPKDGSIYRNGRDAPAIAGRCDSCQTPLTWGGSMAAERVRSWYRTRGGPSRRVAEHFRAQGVVYAVDGTENAEAVLAGLSQLVADR